MKANTLVELSSEELNGQLLVETKKLANYKLSHSVSPLENPIIIRHTRVNIARLKTELSKRKSN